MSLGCFQSRGKTGRLGKGNRDDAAEWMKHRVRALQREVEEMVWVRDKERRRVAEQEALLLLAIREAAEWREERKTLKELVNKLWNMLLHQRRRRTRFHTHHHNNDNGDDWDNEMMMMMMKRDDEAIVDNKWKHLYFAIKVELDRLILTTTTTNNNNNDNQGERGGGRRWHDEGMEKEVRGKEERIRALESRIASLEQQELRRQREADILRQSLRIMFHNNNNNNNNTLSFHLR